MLSFELNLPTIEQSMLPSNASFFYSEESPIFQFWDELTLDQKNALTHQLQNIDIQRLKDQRSIILSPPPSSTEDLTSFDEFTFSGNIDDQLRGETLIKQGKLGCLLLAGGQGTRLRHNGPKGTYPISVVKNKSLFQLCAEKVKAASEKMEYPLKLAIMTSPENDQETRSFFKTHDFFGLQESQISFFIQGSLPFLDANGQLFLQSPCQIAEGPDGNGGSLLSFAKSGILNQWMEEGIEHVHIILVDNPLADPFDPELLGFHVKKRDEITLKCTEKTHPNEKVGVLIKQDNRCGVIEYSEMSEEEKQARRDNGKLKHCCANLSLFCISLSFIDRMVTENKSLPLHKAWKSTSYVNKNGVTILSERPNAWKFEMFIFDWLYETKKVSALIYPREQCFAPLKNSEGADSPETVRQALQEYDKRVIEEITGLAAPSFPFELSPKFHYPTAELIQEWQGKLIEESYINP